jgi:hypothetical protein
LTPNFDLYAGNPRFILGFHGCDESVAEQLIQENPTFKQSENLHDWLGNGMYFWENDPNRAWEYVNEAKQRDEAKQREIYKYPNPTVIGAILDLGHCLNLTENHYKNLLKDAYQKYKNFANEIGIEMPQNKKAYASDHDKLLRPLDRAVIEFLHATNVKKQEFDSVRGMFVEGEELYEGAGFHEKTHVQIAIRNPLMIKGYFRIISEHKEINI